MYNCLDNNNLLLKLL